MKLKIDIKRFVEEPIIKPFHNHEIGFNVQGPSLIKVPEWIKDPLGIYYLYLLIIKGIELTLHTLVTYEGRGIFITVVCYILMNQIS